MPALKRIRVYHAFVAIGTVLAYLIGDLEPVHSYIGYGVAAIVVIRLGMATTEVPLGNWSSLDVSFSADFRPEEVRDEAQAIFG